MTVLQNSDPTVFKAIETEGWRQKNTINLIASENYASKAVLEAQGTFLTNKYAEGYPGKRYYGGCEMVDIIEELAIERVCQLFQSEHANVQPHSGAQANMAAYLALLKPGDTILGMSLSHGGHLTHGASVNFTGKLFNCVTYGLNNKTERIDYDEIEKVAIATNPKMIIAGASAYPRIIDFERFRLISDKIGAFLLADIAHIAGLVATGWHPSPIPYADVVTSTSHKTLRGPRGGFVLCSKEHAKRIDSAVFPAIQGGPLMHVIAAKAVAFGEALKQGFSDYQKAIVDNAQVLAKEMKRAGFRLITGGTDTHLVLVDLTSTGVNGKEAEDALGRCNIVVNRNTVPFIPNQKATIPGGIRLGTPAVTTRGFTSKEMGRIATWIRNIICNIGDQKIEEMVSAEVRDLCQNFPVPGTEE